MMPSFQEGDYLIIDQISYRLRGPKRGEVIVFRSPEISSQRYIKRIIGLPGEEIEVKDNKVFIYKEETLIELDESSYIASEIKTVGNVKISLDEKEYFVLGDNRSVSSDSRKWGEVPEENIIGRVLFRLWPVTALAKIEAPAY